MNINTNDLKLIDTIELDECPICYEADIINKVCLSCNHECCFECFMCRQKINAMHLSKENMFILNCILEEFQNIYNEDFSVDDGVNYVERRNRAFRYIIPILFLYLIYSSYYDNK